MNSTDEKWQVSELWNWEVALFETYLLRLLEHSELATVVIRYRDIFYPWVINEESGTAGNIYLLDSSRLHVPSSAGHTWFHLHHCSCQPRPSETRICLWPPPFFLPQGLCEDKAIQDKEMCATEMSADQCTFRNQELTRNLVYKCSFLLHSFTCFSDGFPNKSDGVPLLTWLFGLCFLPSKWICPESKSRHTIGCTLSQTGCRKGTQVIYKFFELLVIIDSY